MKEEEGRVRRIKHIMEEWRKKEGEREDKRRKKRRKGSPR
jgi:hypothetical protein